MTIKPLLVFEGPIATLSGYGKHARDLLISLIKMDKYDIKVVSTRWGNTPLNQLRVENEMDNRILGMILNSPLPKQPDIFVQVSVPNEFKKVGKFNIGITAGIETTIAPVEFIQGCNNMDLIIVPSVFTKNVLESTSFLEKDKNTEQVISEVKLQVPIEVLFEGTDLEKFKVREISETLSSELHAIPDDFNFLFVGHWLKGTLGEDRKNLGLLIKTFLGVFKNRPSKPGLIIKTSGATFSVLDRERTLNKIREIKASMDGDLPNIHLLHGDLTDYEMIQLYNHKKVKAMVSFTKGEGYGRPLQEFSFVGKPIICSNWSGQVDFLSNYANLIEGELANVHPSAADKFILKEAQWFNVNVGSAASMLNDMYLHYDKFFASSNVMKKNQRKQYNMDAMHKAFEKIMTSKVNIAQEVKLELPKLQLPKLKKVTKNG